MATPPTNSTTPSNTHVTPDMPSIQEELPELRVRTDSLGNTTRTVIPMGDTVGETIEMTDLNGREALEDSGTSIGTTVNVGQPDVNGEQNADSMHPTRDSLTKKHDVALSPPDPDEAEMVEQAASAPFKWKPAVVPNRDFRHAPVQPDAPAQAPAQEASSPFTLSVTRISPEEEAANAQASLSADQIRAHKTNITPLSTEIHSTEKQFVKDLERLQRYADRCRTSGNIKGGVRKFGDDLNTLVHPLLESAKTFEAQLKEALDKKNPTEQGLAVAKAYEDHQYYFTELRSLTLKLDKLKNDLKILANDYPDTMKNINEVILQEKVTYREGKFPDMTFDSLSNKCVARGPKHQELLSKLGENIGKLDPARGRRIGDQVNDINTINAATKIDQAEASKQQKTKILNTLKSGEPSSALIAGIQKHVSQAALKALVPDDITKSAILSHAITSAQAQVQNDIAKMITNESNSQQRAKIRLGLAKSAINLAKTGYLAMANLIIDKLRIKPKEDNELDILNDYRSELAEIRETNIEEDKAKAYAKKQGSKLYLSPQMLDKLSVMPENIGNRHSLDEKKQDKLLQEATSLLNNTVKFLRKNDQSSAIGVFPF